MHGHNLVAVYDSFSVAERVRDRLISEGFPASDIRLSGSPAVQQSTVSQNEEPGFWSWLFGDVSEEHRTVYGSHLRANRAAVSLRVVDEAAHRRALDIMEEFEPIDLGDQGMAGQGMTGQAAAGITQSEGRMAASAPQPAATGTSAYTATNRAGGEAREEVIPVVKEELAVGKRATERHYRVRTHVIERPVEERVMLRDERVEIERRPVTGTAAGAATMPQDRVIDVVERHEQAVAEKKGRVVEEVVVRREVTERPETVRGTVRETQVDVDKEPENVGSRPAVPPTRRP